MKMILKILLFAVSIGEQSIHSQSSALNTKGVFISMGGGIIGPDSRDYHCEAQYKFRGNFVLTANYRYIKNFAIGLRIDFIRAKYTYRDWKYLSFSDKQYCREEYVNVTSIGPEFRLILLAKHRFNIEPSIHIQRAGRRLVKTAISVDRGPFVPAEPRYDYTDDAFFMAGAHVSLSYRLSTHFLVSVSPCIQKFFNEFDTKIGGTVDVTWNF